MYPIWVELPAKDLERALAFYQAVFGFAASEITDDSQRRTVTLLNNTDAGRAGLSLNQTANFEPGRHGALVYLDAGTNLDTLVSRIDAAGGKLVQPKTSMGGSGDFAIFEDTEGNQLALYGYQQ